MVGNLNSFGYVPAENFIDRLDILYYVPYDGKAWEFWKWQSSLRWDSLKDER